MCSTVIVTEKTNILLRYLHQQWDKKVKHFVALIIEFLFHRTMFNLLPQ